MSRLLPLDWTRRGGAPRPPLWWSRSALVPRFSPDADDGASAPLLHARRRSRRLRGAIRLHLLLAQRLLPIRVILVCLATLAFKSAPRSEQPGYAPLGAGAAARGPQQSEAVTVGR